MSFRAAVFRLLLCLPLLPAPADAQSLSLPEDAARTEAFLRQQIPVGISIGDARQRAGQLGLSCSFLSHQPWTGGYVGDYLYCDRQSRDGVISKRWQVALMYKEDKLSDIHATFGLTGP